MSSQRVTASRLHSQNLNNEKVAQHREKEREREARKRRERIAQWDRFNAPAVPLGRGVRLGGPEPGPARYGAQAANNLVRRQEEIDAARLRMQEQNQAVAEAHLEKEKEREARKRRERIAQWDRFNAPAVPLGPGVRLGGPEPGPDRYGAQAANNLMRRQEEIDAARLRMQEQNQAVAEAHLEKEKEREAVARQERIAKWERQSDGVPVRGGPNAGNNRKTEFQQENAPETALDDKALRERRQKEMAAARARMQERYQQEVARRQEDPRQDAD